MEQNYFALLLFRQDTDSIPVHQSNIRISKEGMTFLLAVQGRKPFSDTLVEGTLMAG